MSYQVNFLNNSDNLDIIGLVVKWIKIIKPKFIYILFVSLIICSFVFYLKKTKPNVYKSKIVFVVEEGKGSTPNLGGLASIAGQLGVDLNTNSGTSLFSGENIILYFKSLSLTREVLLSEYKNSKRSFLDYYVEANELNKNWDSEPQVKNISFAPFSNKIKYTRIQDSLIFEISSNILKNQFDIFKVDKKASFIEVNVKMRDEELAKFFVEKIVEIAVNKYIKTKTLRQKTSVDNLQARVDSISKILFKKTQSSAVLQTSANTMDINPLFKTATNVSNELNTRDKTLLATIFASVTQNLELAKFQLSQETPVIQLIDTPRFPLEKEKKSILKSTFIAFVLSLFLFSFFLILREYFKYYNLSKK